MELAIAPELKAGRWFGQPRSVLLLAVLLALCCSSFLAWQIRNAMLQPDEMSYRFQARILRTGHLRAPPLPGVGADGKTPAEVHFNHHIATPGGWSVMYPIGWPLVLAAGQALGASWLVTPLLGVLLIWLTFQLGRAVADEETGAAAAVLLFPCPFFFVCTSGDMPHAMAACMVAGATWALVDGLKHRSAGRCALGFLLIGLTLFVHPFTALGVSAGVGVALLVYLWRDRDILRRIMPWLAVILAFIALLFALQNRFFTGSAFRSTYAFSAGTKTPPEVSLDIPAVLAHAPENTLPGLLATIYFSTPFLFVLAACAFVRTKKAGPQAQQSASGWALLLTGAFVGEVCLNNLNLVGNIGLPGQRMYFEGMPGISVLGALGLPRVLDSWRVRRAAWYLTLTLLGAFQLLQYGLEVHDIRARVRPSLIFRHALSQVDLPGGIVFMRTENMPRDEGFASYNYNVNDADWPHARTLYLIDPGPSRRAEAAHRFGRTKWVVVTYDGMAQSCNISPTNAAS